MGRPGLTNNRKFSRLVRELQPVCKAFAEQVARGALELMWEGAYEKGDDYLGDVADVEDAAHWTGKKGALCAALLVAGGDGETGFIEEIEGRPEHYMIHDLYDHAPEYVRKRMEREAARIKKGKNISDIRRDASRKRWDANGSKRKTDALQTATLAMQTSANGFPPAPSPTPTPKTEAGPSAPAAAALAQKINAEWPDLKAGPEAAEAWGRAFPGINLAAETRLARAHWASNGPSRKQGDFPTAFLNRWFRTASQGSSFLRPQARGAAQLQINEEAKAEHAVPGRKIL